jgi:hypothetical protein
MHACSAGCLGSSSINSSSSSVGSRASNKVPTGHSVHAVLVIRLYEDVAGACM